jgi:predicted permease
MDTMTENDYLHAWAIYAVAAVGCLLVWFRITRWMWRWLREPLRVLGVVALAAPTLIDPIQEKYAPAVAVTALDLVFKVGTNALRTLSELLMYGIIALGLYLVFALIRWPFLRKAAERRQAAARAALLETAAVPEAVGSRQLRRDTLSRTPPVPDSRSRVEPRV